MLTFDDMHIRTVLVSFNADVILQGKLCNRFGIKRYPTMKFGHAADFGEGSEQGLAEINGKLSAEEVVKWLSKRQNM